LGRTGCFGQQLLGNRYRNRAEGNQYRRILIIHHKRGLSPLNKSRGAAMSIIGWIVLGLISGFIASKIVNKSGEGVLLDIILGIVGAVVGGFLFNRFGAAGVTGFNLYSMVVAVVGAIVVLVIYHLVVGRRAI
jgi:uncharacterized membrane protein YeaQ/YmgE (transglycosylase-associated protein family)